MSDKNGLVILADLKDERKKELKNVFKDISKLIEFRNKVTPRLFVFMYGDRSGPHMWEKFIKHHRDMLSFIQDLDENNLIILLANVYVLKHPMDPNPLYAHC